MERFPYGLSIPFLGEKKGAKKIREEKTHKEIKPNLFKKKILNLNIIEMLG